jgi:hypothetical protein
MMQTTLNAERLLTPSSSRWKWLIILTRFTLFTSAAAIAASVGTSKIAILAPIWLGLAAKVLDLPGWLGLGYEPRDVYTVQFLVSASSNYGTFDVNKSCFINDDILTKTATTINKPEPMKQTRLSSALQS